MVQALLAAPRAFEHGGVLAAVAARELIADGGPTAGGPGRLDEQPAGGGRAGLGDRALTAALAAGGLGRGQADEAHKLLGGPKTREVADLTDQAQRGQGVDATDAAQPRDQLGVRPRVREAVELLLERVDATVDLVDGEQVVVKGVLLAGQLEDLAPEPSPPGHAPAGRRHPAVVAQHELPQPVASAQDPGARPRGPERDRATPQARARGRRSPSTPPTRATPPACAHPAGRSLSDPPAATAPARARPSRNRRPHRPSGDKARTPSGPPHRPPAPPATRAARAQPARGQRATRPPAPPHQPAPRPDAPRPYAHPTPPRPP